MRIGIEAHAAEREGSGNCTYIRHLLLELGRIDTRNDYFIYVINPSHPFYQKLKKYKNFYIKSLYVKNPFLRIPIFLGWRSFADGLDLLHVQYIAPPFHRGQLILTVHDLGHFVIPHAFSRFEVFRSRILIPKAVHRAKFILTGSRHARSEIREKFSIPPEKIIYIPYGVSPEFFKFSSFNLAKERFSYIEKYLSRFREHDEKDSAEEKAGENIQGKMNEIINVVRKKYIIKGPYFFSLSRLNPRKNIPLLIEAFNLLKASRSIPHQLLIGGKVDVNYKRLIEVINKSPYKDDINLLGFVPEDDLGYLYSGAEAFIFLSEYEGFGLPVLEAMACGVPVIASFIGPIREVAADDALYVESFSPHEVAAKMLTLIEDRNLNQKLREKGVERACLFSWQETARLTLQAYERAVHGEVQTINRRPGR